MRDAAAWSKLMSIAFVANGLGPFGLKSSQLRVFRRSNRNICSGGMREDRYLRPRRLPEAGSAFVRRNWFWVRRWDYAAWADRALPAYLLLMECPAI